MAQLHVQSDDNLGRQQRASRDNRQSKDWRRKNFAEAIRAATGLAAAVKELSRAEAGVLMAIAYFQPVTRGEISEMFGREVSRDLIGSLRAAGLIAAGQRSPQLGAPYAQVTTPGFLSEFGFESLRDLPDLEKLEDAGLLGRAIADGLGAPGARLWARRAGSGDWTIPGSSPTWPAPSA